MHAGVFLNIIVVCELHVNKDVVVSFLENFAKCAENSTFLICRNRIVSQIALSGFIEAVY